MSKFLLDKYERLEPYVPGEQRSGDVIKLNTNESPYSPSPKVLSRISEERLGRNLNKYPDPEALSLRRAIASHLQAETCGYFDERNILPANGSDEILAFAVMAYAAGGKLVFPDISYGFYKVFAGIFGATADMKALQCDYSIAAEEYFDAGGSIVIANPNAPTGMILSISEVERILRKNPENIVIIDEAYMDFSDKKNSAVNLVGEYDNLLIVRTFSKSASLAGMRVGYAVGNEELIGDLALMKYSFNPYNVNSIALAAAEAALADWGYYEECITEIKKNRSDFAKFLKSYDFHILPSESNFVFASPSGIGAEELFNELNKRNIMVRYFKNERVDKFLRITIGTKEEMDILKAAIADIMN